MQSQILFWKTIYLQLLTIELREFKTNYLFKGNDIETRALPVDFALVPLLLTLHRY